MKTNKLGSNGYKTKYRYKFYKSVLFLLLLCILVLVWSLYFKSNELLSPVPKDFDKIRTYIVPVTYAKEGALIDIYVDEAARKFGKGKDGYSKLKATLHCLLYYETKHGYAMGMGDGGKAGGLFQFWEGTWNRMRTQMVKAGLAKAVYTRFDDKEAVMTTAWAISNGRAKEWGPILRGDCSY